MNLRDLTVSYNPTFKRAAGNAKVYYYHRDNYYFLGTSLDGIVYSTVIAASVDIDDFIANYISTATEFSYEGDVIANAVMDATSSQTKYDVQDTTTYIGYAPTGVLTSAAAWTIERITFDGDGNPIAKNSTRTFVAMWDNRATETYY